MDQILQTSENGTVQDIHVERLFADLFYGTHSEDEISLGNFRIYLKALNDCELPCDSFSDTQQLMTIAATIGIIEMGPAENDSFYARYKHWNDDELVIGRDIAIAAALCIVHNMRLSVAAIGVNPGDIKH